MARRTLKEYEAISKVLHYNPDTGDLNWTKDVGTRAKEGDLITSTDADGYVCFMFNYVTYKANQVAHFIMTGRVARIVDHKDRDTSNNRWGNLREATDTQNQYNKVKRKGVSKYKGVKFEKDGRAKPWRALIMEDDKIRYISFKTEIEAAVAHEKSAKDYHGEFFHPQELLKDYDI